MEITSIPAEVCFAEEQLIAKALLDPKCFDEVALPYNNFFDPRKREIWKVLGELRSAGVPVDELSVATRCRGLSVSDLTELTCGASFTGDATALAHMIRSAYLERELLQLGATYSTWKQRGLLPGEILGKLSEHLDNLSKNEKRELPTLLDLASKQRDSILLREPDDCVGLPSGIGIERVVPGGIPLDKVTTIFSESGNFKTTLVGNLATSFARSGYTGLWCSFEDSDELTAIRSLSQQTGVNYGTLAAGALTASEKQSLAKAAIPDWTGNLLLAGDIAPNIDEIIRTARYYKQNKDLSFVIVDYIQLLEGSGKLSERELLNQIMRKAQLSAKRDGIAYIFVSQVKQDVDQRDDHRPRVTDMLGSSAMRTASKLLIGVYRPSLYRIEPNKKDPYYNLYVNHPDGERLYSEMLELHIMKNVLGEAMVVVHCTVNKSTGVITPFDMRPWK